MSISSKDDPGKDLSGKDDPQTKTYCAEQDVELSMAGTADRVDVWLLLEYRGTWTPKVLTQAPFADPVRAWFAATTAAFAEQGLRLRMQLIRQPEVRSAGVRLFLSGRERCAQLHLEGYGDLPQIDALACWRDATGATPAYFVCTNGQRDVCCSRLGRPIYVRLRELVGERAWQVTHLGGHRYAPNVLVTPANLLYGRVHAAAVDEFVARVERGAIDFPRLRGRSAYTPAVQAAECFLGAPGLTLLHVDEAADETVCVEFADARRRHRIRVGRAAEPHMILASCADSTKKPFHPFEARASLD